MTNVLVLALTWAIAAPEAVPVCTPLWQRSLRPRGIMELTLRATSDSVRDTHRSVGATEPGHRTRRLSDTAPVFAQVFELLTADGDLGPLRPGRRQRVALVWWNLGMACDRTTPEPAVHRDIDELFLIARAAGRPAASYTGELDAVGTDLRPRNDWIGGMPTFDVSYMAWSYSPRFQRPTNLPKTVRGDLTVAEYREFFAHLPRSGDTQTEMAASRRRLFRWADADPRRWSLYPAVYELWGPR